MKPYECIFKDLREVRPETTKCPYSSVGVLLCDDLTISPGNSDAWCRRVIENAIWEGEE